MLFKDLIQNVELRSYSPSLDNVEISDIKIDSRLVKKGDLFIALSGTNYDGNNFIDDAIANGASIIMTDKDLHGENFVRVLSARKAYAMTCKNFFGRACDQMKIVAVTGTNGKTTICNTVKDMLKSTGAVVGTIGTLGASFNNKTIDTGFTTPDPYILHKVFAEMKEGGVEYVVMEASAHALALEKLEGINFEVGVLTNITEDHLDFFKTMKEYAKAKYKLFERGRTKQGIVCDDDAYCKYLLLNSKIPILSYGLSDGAVINAYEIVKTFNGTRFKCDYAGEKQNFEMGLVGDYNIKNALASIAICKNLGIPFEKIRSGLKCVKFPEGRFNVIKMGKTNIIVDYAHTPDGLENVLQTAKDLSDGKVVAVFGCGGNRDRMKRALMGQIAEQNADRVILTSDNPRFEDPMSIIRDIKAGMISKRVTIIENRKKAIEYALEKYNNGETIIIAGKGAEKYQDIMGKKIPYNDYDVIYSFINSHEKANKEASLNEGENDL